MEKTGEHTMALVTGVNAGIIDSGGRAMVVDTLFGPQFVAPLKGALAEGGLVAQYVFNTHYHSDHTFGNCAFDCPVVASTLCSEKMRANLAGPWSKDGIQKWLEANPQAPTDFSIKPPDLAFSSALTVYLGDLQVKMELFDGHTPGSSIAVIEQDGVIFAGDLLFIGRYPFVGDGKIARWCTALRRLLEVAAGYRAVVPGHGPILWDDAIPREAGKLLSFFEGCLDVASSLVDKGVPREEALASPAFPALQTDQPQAGERRKVCIARVYDEVLSWGKR